MQTYKRLGELLVMQGAINNLQLSIALADQRISSRRLGEILLERNFASEADIAQCLAHQYGYPVDDLSEVKPTAAALQRLSAEDSLQLGALPIEDLEEGLVIAISDPIDVLSTDRLAALTRSRLIVRIAPHSKLKAAIRHFYGLQEPVAPVFEKADLAPSRFKGITVRGRYEYSVLLDAFDELLDRQVSLICQQDGTPAATKAFRMIRSAARIATDGVVPIFDSIVHSGYRWTIVQQLHGDSLERILKARGPRSVPQAAEWVGKIAEVVDNLLRNGATPAWVCPANVILRNNRVELAPVSLPPTRYASPNKAFDAENPSQAAVYSVGVLLQDCLCGMDVSLTGGLPPAMRDILSSCLDDDSSRRFGSPIEIATALGSYNWNALCNPMAQNTTAERDHLLETLFARQPADPPSAVLDSPKWWQRLFKRSA